MSLDRMNRVARLMVVVGLSVATTAWAQAPAAESAKAEQPKVEATKAEAPKKAEPKKDASGLPTGKEVMDRFVEVTGGRAAYEKLTSRRQVGTMEMPSMGVTGKVEMLTAAPNKMKMVMDMGQMGGTTQATDGVDAWAISPAMGGAMLMEGEELEQTIRSAVFNQELRYAEVYATVVTTGVEKVKGLDGSEVEALVVELTSKKGDVETRYFDKASGMLIKTVTTAKSPMGEMKVEALASDYKEIDGVKVPHTLTLRPAGMELVMKMTTIEHNVDLKDAFVMPEEVKALKKAPAAPALESPAAPAAEAPKAPAAPAGEAPKAPAPK